MTSTAQHCTAWVQMGIGPPNFNFLRPTTSAKGSGNLSYSRFKLSKVVLILNIYLHPLLHQLSTFSTPNGRTILINPRTRIQKTFNFSSPSLLALPSTVQLPPLVVHRYREHSTHGSVDYFDLGLWHTSLSEWTLKSGNKSSQPRFLSYFFCDMFRIGAIETFQLFHDGAYMGRISRGKEIIQSAK